MLAQKLGISLSESALRFIKFKKTDLILEKLKSAPGTLICLGMYFKWPSLSALKRFV